MGFSPVAAWIHGHTHDSCGYIEQGTRVVCNPRGYELNAAFDPIMTIEVDPLRPLQRAPKRIDPPGSQRGERIRSAA